MLKEILGRCIDYLKRANIYLAKNEDTIEQRRNQIISTRLFILLFFSSLIGLVGYASLTLRLTNVQIENPSQSTFEKLYSLYSETLFCPCSQTSIQIDKFVDVYVSYHQICSSIFVNDEWILSISHLIPNIFYSLDIRRMISSQLQLIASQCRSSQIVVREALKSIASSQLFIPTMISRDVMNSQVDKTVNEVTNYLVAEQIQSRNLIQTGHQQNQIVSALSNFALYRNIDDIHQGFYLVKYLKDWTYPPVIGFTNYTNSQLCYCIDSSNCTYPSGIYPNLTGFDSYQYYGSMIPPMISSTQISGLYIGCMSFNSIMESTLECFYDNNCLLELFNKTNMQSLNSSINTIDTKISTLIEEFFVESWSSETDFESFFNECQPKKCTYSYNSRGNVGYVISVMLSLVGGLFVALKIASSFIVISYKKVRNKITIKLSQAASSPNENNQDNSSVSNERVSNGRKMFDTIRKWISNFNLFEHAYNDAHGRRTEIITTRIYLILMFIGLIVIIFYASLVQYSITYRIESPSLNTYHKLVNKYPSLTCECEEITALYSAFVSFSPRFHQICSSLYASAIFTLNLENRDELIVLGKTHLQSIEGSYFNIISALCSLSKEIATQLIDTFLQTIYISNQLTHEVEFISNINASIENFKVLAPPATIHLMQLMQDITQGNQLLTNSFSNAILQYNISSTIEDNKINILPINPINESCSCGMSLDSCDILYDKYCNYTYTYTYGDPCNIPIPGMYIGCYVSNTMLLTSLECLYDVKCISTIVSIIQTKVNINIDLIPQSAYLLDKNIKSRFYPNSTVFDILNELGVEDWNNNIEYELYYNKCNPINCLYTITTNFNIPTVITTIIGLIGGLSVILQIVIPPIIEFLRKRRRVQIVHVEIPVHESWNHRLIKNIREMNLFKSAETDQSIEKRYNQIVSTRLYIILWIIFVIVLGINTGLSEKKITVNVDFPSMSVVNQLQLENLNEFSCPCSKTTIPFGTFTSLNFTFHQICSSDFVSNRWLEGLFNFTIGYSVHRGVLSSHFKLLQSFCQSSNETLIYSINNFYVNQFISVNLLTQNQFINQIQSSIQDFQTQTIGSFQRNLASIIDITLGDQLMSAYETNWYFIPDPNGNYPIYTKSRSYRNCSCGSSQSLYCIDQLFINDNTTVSGMFIGCLPITSLRLSSFQCFYDQICLDEVKEALDLTNLSMISLDPSQSSQFPMNTTLGPIIDNLMLEEWTNKINYTEYFNQCNLQQCTYSITKRNNPLVIFTTLLGLYGGLTTTLRFIAPTIVKIVQNIRNRCRLNRKITPESL